MHDTYVQVAITPSKAQGASLQSHLKALGGRKTKLETRYLRVETYMPKIADNGVAIKPLSQMLLQSNNSKAKTWSSVYNDTPLHRPHSNVSCSNRLWNLTLQQLAMEKCRLSSRIDPQPKLCYIWNRSCQGLAHPATCSTAHACFTCPLSKHN